MKQMNHLAVTEDLSGTWCNASAVTSSVMEAVSFVTPVLEKFFILTVKEGVSEDTPAELRERCMGFIQEEADHSRVHNKFNSSVLKYLGQVPPGLALVETLLDMARRRLSLPKRLLIAAALEHFAAVLSKVYVNQGIRLDFESPYAQEMFLQHAREEIDHRSVVFDLWLSTGTIGSFGRTLAIAGILLAGFVYVSVAVTWILYRKNCRHLFQTMADLGCFAVKNRLAIKAYSPLSELFSFVRRGFHPDLLVRNN